MTVRNICVACPRVNTIILVVSENWNGSAKQAMFDKAIEELRLKVDQIVTISGNSSATDKSGSAGFYSARPDWTWKGLTRTEASLEEITDKKREIKKFYRSLNRKMVEMSSETHLLFMALPPMPDDVSCDEHWTRFYFDCLCSLTRDLPPTALVATAERIPVMTIDV